MLKNRQKKHLPFTPTGIAQFCGFRQREFFGDKPLPGEVSYDQVNNVYSSRERFARQAISTTTALASAAFLAYEVGLS